MKRAALLLLLAACKKPGPQARSCDQDLSGLWLNSSDRRFAYRFTDQNGTVRGEFLNRAGDGGLTRPDEPILFELRRSGAEVAGVMKSTGAAPSGKPCPVEYAIRLSECKPDALQAIVETSAVIGEDCKRRTAEDGGEIPRDLSEFRFERAR